MIKQLLLSLAVTAPMAMMADNYYITPEGAGDKTGSTWENALDFNGFMSKMTWNKTNDDHTGNTYYFATGEYVFTSTGFAFNSGLTLLGSYDPATGEPATTGRTVFTGNDKTRKNGAFFLQPNTVLDENGKKRTITITGIDFTNFITNDVWRDGNATNWNYGMPTALYIVKCGYAVITDCTFAENKCIATGQYTDDNNNKQKTDKIMAGAVSLNRVSAIFKNCRFINNEGTQGGAVKIFYSMGGGITKILDTTFEGCYFSGNKTNNSGAAIMARNSMNTRIINCTITGNNAEQSGGGVYVNGPGFYDNKCEIISSTIAGNTAAKGNEVFTNAKGALTVANSIIATTDGDAIVDASASTAAYDFKGFNFIGAVAEGYTKTDNDNIQADNTYGSIFGTNVAEENGTIKPVKFVQGMAPADLTELVKAWPYTVDATVDQTGNKRSNTTGCGALVIDKSTGIDDVIVDNDNADDSWYNLQGIRLDGEPTAPGIYINKGKKIMLK